MNLLDDKLIHQLATFYETHRRIFCYKQFDLHIMLYIILHEYFGYNGGITPDGNTESKEEEPTMTFSEFIAALQEKQEFEYLPDRRNMANPMLWREIYQNQKFGIVHDVFYAKESIGSVGVFYKGVPVVLEDVPHNRIPRGLVTFIEFLDGEGDDMPEKLTRCFKLAELELKTLEQDKGGLQ